MGLPTLLGALVWVAGAAGCDGATELDRVGALLVPSESRVDFGEAVMGTEVERTLTLQSAGGAAVRLSALEVEGEAFSLAAAVQPVTLAAGASLQVPLRFVPAGEGPASGALTVLSDASNAPSLSVSLTGVGTAVPDCDDANVCTLDHFDAAALACAHDPLSGGDCSASAPCLVAPICVQGQCVGEPVMCPAPTSLCERATCVPGQGCVSMEDPAACDDDNPCTLDTCDAVLGCAHEVVDNGTPCGPIQGCASAPLCLAGACVDVAVPDGTPCDDSDLCTHTDRCLAGNCVGEAQPGTPEAVASIALGAPAGWTAVGGGLAVAAVRRGGFHWELMLFRAATGVHRMELLDTWEVTYDPRSSGSSNDRLTPVMSGGQGRLLVARDDPEQAGQRQLTLVEVVNDTFTDAVVLGEWPELYALRGKVARGDHVLLCLQSEPVLEGQVWLAQLEVQMTVTPLGRACTALVDDGSGDHALLVAQEGGDDQATVRTLDVLLPYGLGPTLYTGEVAAGVPVFAHDELLVIRRGLDDDEVVNLSSGSVGPLPLSIEGHTVAFDASGLWVRGDGVIQRWDLEGLGSATLLDSWVDDILDGNPLTLPIAHVTEQLFIAGDTLAERTPGGGLSLRSHPRLGTPTTLQPHGAGAVFYSTGTVGAVSLVDDNWQVSAGGRWRETASLIALGPAGAPPVFLASRRVVMPQAAAPVGARIIDAAQLNAPVPRGSVDLASSSVAVESDGRMLVSLDYVIFTAADGDQITPRLTFSGLTNLSPEQTAAPLPELAFVPTATSFPGPLMPTGVVGDVALHGPSKTAAWALGFVDKTLVGLVSYDSEALSTPEPLNAVFVDGDLLGVVSGAGTALLVVDLELGGGTEFGLRRVDVVDGAPVPVAVDFTVPGGTGFWPLLWDGEHLLYRTHDWLHWVQIDAAGVSTTMGALQLEGVIAGVSTPHALIVSSGSKVTAVSPPCPGE